MKYDGLFRRTAITAISGWLGIFALMAFLLVLGVSFLQADPQHMVRYSLTSHHYLQLLDPLYLRIFVKSFSLALLCTLCCFIIAYPFAYFLSLVKDAYKSLLMLLLIIPFWTSSLVRSYAIMAILKTKGLVNSLLLSLGLIHLPLQLLFTNVAVLIGLVYNLLPFMILPLYANFERLEPDIIEAARDLGASRWVIFSRVLLPLTKPGIYAGIMMVFLPAMTLFYIPDLLGGAKSLLLGNLIQQQFLFANNWPLGSALSMVLTLLMGIMLYLYWRTQQRQQGGIMP